MAATVAVAIAENLRNRGISEFFAQSLPSSLVLAAEDRGIRQIVYRTENAGGAMADGFARVSRRCAVVMAQNGPAAALLVPPLAEAAKASTPVVALVQDVPRPHRNKNAFQEFDHRSLFAWCKWFDRLDDPERTPDYLDAAFRAATSGRPGPAVLDRCPPNQVSTGPRVPAAMCRWLRSGPCRSCGRSRSRRRPGCRRPRNSGPRRVFRAARR